MSTNQSNAKYLNIRDIAKLAGVSTATVSRVLNHPELTSPEIRARVQAIVQEHHYVPNQMVKSLFSHSADSIAAKTRTPTVPSARRRRCPSRCGR